MALLVVAMMWHKAKKNLTREIKALYRREEQQIAHLGFYESYLNLQQQCAVFWNRQTSQFWMIGTIIQNEAQDFIIPQDIEKFLDFAAWLPPHVAQNLAQAIIELEKNATSFDLNIEKEDNTPWLCLKGQCLGSYMMLSFLPIGVRAQENWQQKSRADDLELRLTTLQMLLDEVKQPIWMRDHDGVISWGNRAYFRVSGADYEFLPHDQRDKIKTTLEKNESYFGKVSAIIDGERHILDVSVIKGPSGSAGHGVDATKRTALEEQTNRTVTGYLALFEELPTALSIFDARQNLVFFNHAFAQLWPLEVSFLEEKPSHGLVLDRLREKQILAENPGWHGWKEELFAAYRGVDSQTTIWNLPDGRTLRVIAIPGPEDGVTWLYEDLSEKLQLEARYNSLIYMQGETLDHLHEGIALFGPDGLLRLANPTFAQCWGLPPDLTISGVHISQIEAFCASLCASRHGREDWYKIAAQVTGFCESRETLSARIEHFDGRIYDYMLVPLPQGQTMLSFVDVSDSVQVARALHERNEALESADRLRTDFVSHVSYQLRTPLTNIIGFTDLLRTPSFGSLSARQYEYLNNIAAQSHELLELVNDILDLATVDAGIMQLDMSAVNILEAMQAAADRIKERLSSRQIDLHVHFDGDHPFFHADARRIHQILFNLLANAANFAPDGSVIDLIAKSERSFDGVQIIFQVHDEGGGIPDDILHKVFDRFYGQAHHGSRPGAGLGLSLVKSFVELHHGTVEIETGTGQGTTIICRFPQEAPLFITSE